MELRRQLIILLLNATPVFAQTGSIFVDENHNGHKIFGLPTPAASNEAATKDYVDAHAGGGGAVSLTATTPIVVTPSPITGTGVISIADTAVTPGSYTNTNLTVDAKGRITAASNGSAGGGTPVPATTPGGSNTQIQYNNSGAFGGISTFTTNGTNVSLSNSGVANFAGAGTNSLRIGTGSVANGLGSVSYGNTANTLSSGGVAIGALTIADTNSVAVGWSATSAALGVALGSGAQSKAAFGSIAIGDVSIANYDGSIVIGASSFDTAAQQLIIGTWENTHPIRDVYIGGGVTNVSANLGQTTTYHVTGGEGTNQIGENLSFAGGIGTGTGAGGSISFKTAPAGSTGSTPNTLVNRLTLDSTGLIALDSSATITGKGTVPTGGTTNQVLSKNSNTNYDVGWATVTAGGGGSVTSITATSPIVVTPTPLIATGVVSIDKTVDLAMTAAQSISLTNATTAAVDDLFTVSHNSSGTAGTGFGTGLLFRAESSTTNDMNQGEIQTAWTTATHGSRTSSMNFLLEGNGGTNLASVMKLWGTISGGGGLSVGGTVDPGQQGVINAAAGYKVADGAAAGKILQGNATLFVPSTQTWPTTSGAAGYTIRSDGTNFSSYPQDMLNSSVSSQSPSTSDVYLTGSNVAVTAGDMKAKGQYRCLFDMAKTAGTGAIVITVRVGTGGVVGDPAILTFTFGAGTSVADTGTFEVIATWRTVGTGTSAVMQGICRAQKNAATTTGLWNNAGTDLVIVAATSSGFNSSTATNIGVSFNGATAFAGTNTLVQASLLQ